MNKRIAIIWIILLMIGTLAPVINFMEPDTATAETNPPTSEVWTYEGRTVYTLSGDWTIDPLDDLTYTNAAFDFGINDFIVAGGEIAFYNCSFLLGCLVDQGPGGNIRFTEGAANFYNCTIEHKGKNNGSVTEKSIRLRFDSHLPASNNEITVNMFNTTVNALRFPTFTTPSSESNFVQDSGNFTAYNSILNTPEIYLNTRGTYDNTSFVGSTVIGNRSRGANPGIARWFNYHTINIPDVTAEWWNIAPGEDLVILDANDNATTSITAIEYGLNDIYLYRPMEYNFPLLVLNHTETGSGIETGITYPLEVNISRNSTWTTSSLITGVEYGPYNHQALKLLEDSLQANITWTFSEAEEDLFNNRVETSNLTITSDYILFNLNCPIVASSTGVTTDWGNVQRTDNGSFTLDYVTHTPSAGADRGVVTGGSITITGTFTGTNSASNYTWGVYDGATLQETLYTSTPTFDSTGYTVGTYTVTVNVTDDEGAQDVDSMLLTVDPRTPATQAPDTPVRSPVGDVDYIEQPDSSTTPGTGSGTTAAADSWDWSTSNWYRFWEADYWTEGIAGTFSDNALWITTGAVIAILVILELFGAVKPVSGLWHLLRGKW